MTQAQARSGAIDALLQEERRYPPPPDFAAQTNSRDPQIYEAAS